MEEDVREEKNPIRWISIDVWIKLPTIISTWMNQIVRDTGLTAADACQRGGRYDPQPVTRSSE